jgi:hypothetical protein
MTTSTFIFVHDQQIVLDYIAAGKFSDLPDVKYVFLGMRPTEQIEHLPNVIIARNLPDNIEHFPNLVAWTGWYALVRNNLIKTDLVNLFEYDVNVVGEWVQSNESCGYFLWAITDATWWNYNGISSELRKAVPDSFWGEHMIMTSNYTLRKKLLINFVEKIESLFVYDLLNPVYENAGHVIERICSYWFDAIGLNRTKPLNSIHFKPNSLTHLYADSHGTQGRGDRYQQLKSKLL